MEEELVRKLSGIDKLSINIPLPPSDQDIDLPQFRVCSGLVRGMSYSNWASTASLDLE